MIVTKLRSTLQWYRQHHRRGTAQFERIEGATSQEYFPNADDVGTVLRIEAQGPYGGDIVSVETNEIAVDPTTHAALLAHVTKGHAGTRTPPLLRPRLCTAPPPATPMLRAPPLSKPCWSNSPVLDRSSIPRSSARRASDSAVRASLVCTEFNCLAGGGEQRVLLITRKNIKVRSRLSKFTTSASTIYKQGYDEPLTCVVDENSQTGGCSAVGPCSSPTAALVLALLPTAPVNGQRFSTRLTERHACSPLSPLQRLLCGWARTPTRLASRRAAHATSPCCACACSLGPLALLMRSRATTTWMQLAQPTPPLTMTMMMQSTHLQTSWAHAGGLPNPHTSPKICPHLPRSAQSPKIF